MPIIRTLVFVAPKIFILFPFDPYRSMFTRVLFAIRITIRIIIWLTIITTINETLVEWHLFTCINCNLMCNSTWFIGSQVVLRTIVIIVIQNSRK